MTGLRVSGYVRFGPMVLAPGPVASSASATSLAKLFVVLVVESLVLHNCEAVGVQVLLRLLVWLSAHAALRLSVWVWVLVKDIVLLVV